MSEQEFSNSQQQQDIDESLIVDAQLSQAGDNSIQIKDADYNYININNNELNNFQLNPNEESSLKLLQKNVKEMWIEESELLSEKKIINLEVEEQPEAIKKAKVTSNSTKKILSPPGSKGIIRKIEQMEHTPTLLILGDEKGGKTTILLEIARFLIERTNKNKEINYPVPVVFDFLDWSNEHKKIIEWFVSELNTKYEVSKKVANSLISKQVLFLILDNLDKIESVEDQQSIIQLLNDFIQEHRCTGIIVSYNKNEYESLSARFKFQSAIYIRRPTLSQLEKISRKIPAQNITIKKIINKIEFPFRKKRKKFFKKNKILILLITFILALIIFINPPISAICHAKSYHDDIKLILLRFFRIKNMFNGSQHSNSRKYECFVDVKKVPNNHYSYGGSTSWIPAKNAIEQALKDERLLNFTLEFTKPDEGSVIGIDDLINKKLDFVIASENFTRDEQINAGQHGVLLESQKVAQDVVIMVVSRKLIEKDSNSYLAKNGISASSIEYIYSSPDKLSWNQVNGPRNIPIIPYSRRKNSGTVRWFEKNILTHSSFSENVRYFRNSNQALQQLNAGFSSNEIGGIYYGTASELLQQCAFLPLSIETQEGHSIKPYESSTQEESCPNGAKRNKLNLEVVYRRQYPFVRSLYVIYDLNNSRSKEAGTAYANLLLTEEGQDIFEKNNYAKKID